MIAGGILRPRVHGMGRLFDGIGALCLGRTRARYEGQIADDVEPRRGRGRSRRVSILHRSRDHAVAARSSAARARRRRGSDRGVSPALIPGRGFIARSSLRVWRSCAPCPERCRSRSVVDASPIRCSSRAYSERSAIAPCTSRARSPPVMADSRWVRCGSRRKEHRYVSRSARQGPFRRRHGRDV